VTEGRVTLAGPWGDWHDVQLALQGDHQVENAGLALAALWSRDEARASDGLHHPAKAQRVVQLFMSGAASQCDTFDYKPAIIKKNGG